MGLKLDHFFILTDNPEKCGDLLVSLGMKESFSREHQGQGTANRRFIFSNGMLELLYLRDSNEFNNGPAKNLRLEERVLTETASPFGIVLARTNGSEDGMPFDGWTYQPDYFKAPNAFHIGDNSEILEEPLCIYAPFITPVDRGEESGTLMVLSEVKVFLPLAKASDTLHALQAVDRLKIELGAGHLVVITLDSGRKGIARDLRPDLPLIIKL